MGPYKCVSIKVIKQWHSSCLGNHLEQVAVVKIDIVPGEKGKQVLKEISGVHLAPCKVRQLEE